MIEILIPTYNRRKFLQQNIESIFSQKSSSNIFKILVVDNASTDDTEEYMKNIVSNKIRYIRNNANIGVEKNIIKSLVCSKSEYIMLMGDDDLLYNTASDVLKSVLENYQNLSAIISSADVFVDNKKKVTRTFYNFKNFDNQIYIKSPSKAIQKFLLRGTLMSGIILKRNTLDMEGIKKHTDSLYPQLYMLGMSMGLGPTIFINKPFLLVRDENKKNWRYKYDFMNKAVIDIIKDVCQKNNITKSIQKNIIKQRISECHNLLITSKRNGIRIFLRVVRAHLSIQEYRNSLRFWFFFIAIFVLGESVIFSVGHNIKKRILNK